MMTECEVTQLSAIVQQLGKAIASFQGASNAEGVFSSVESMNQRLNYRVMLNDEMFDIRFVYYAAAGGWTWMVKGCGVTEFAYTPHDAALLWTRELRARWQREFAG